MCLARFPSLHSVQRDAKVSGKAFLRPRLTDPALSDSICKLHYAEYVVAHVVTSVKRKIRENAMKSQLNRINYNNKIDKLFTNPAAAFTG